MVSRNCRWVSDRAKSGEVTHARYSLPASNQQPEGGCPTFGHLPRGHRRSGTRPGRGLGEFDQSGNGRTNGNRDDQQVPPLAQAGGHSFRAQPERICGYRVGDGPAGAVVVGRRAEERSPFGHQIVRRATKETPQGEGELEIVDERGPPKSGGPAHGHRGAAGNDILRRLPRRHLQPVLESPRQLEPETLIRPRGAERRAHRSGCPPQFGWPRLGPYSRSEEHTSEIQSGQYLVCRLLLEKKHVQKLKAPGACATSFRSMACRGSGGA